MKKYLFTRNTVADGEVVLEGQVMQLSEKTAFELIVAGKIVEVETPEKKKKPPEKGKSKTMTTKTAAAIVEGDKKKK